jgi:hypothetical protein
MITEIKKPAEKMIAGTRSIRWVLSLNIVVLLAG